MRDDCEEESAFVDLDATERKPYVLARVRVRLAEPQGFSARLVKAVTCHVMAYIRGLRDEAIYDKRFNMRRSANSNHSLFEI